MVSVHAPVRQDNGNKIRPLPERYFWIVAVIGIEGGENGNGIAGINEATSMVLSLIHI